LTSNHLIDVRYKNLGIQTSPATHSLDQPTEFYPYPPRGQFDAKTLNGLQSRHAFDCPLTITRTILIQRLGVPSPAPAQSLQPTLPMEQSELVVASELIPNQHNEMKHISNSTIHHSLIASDR